MHARELIDLAAWLSIRASDILDRPFPIPRSSIEPYGIHSRDRFERWQRALHQLSEGRGQSGQCATDDGSVHAVPADAGAAMRPVLEEILVSESLTRVWLAVAMEHDMRWGVDDLSRAARNALSDHLDARNRVLRMMTSGQGSAGESLSDLDRLRRCVERWHDVMIGEIGCGFPASHLAFDRDRADAITAELRTRGGHFGADRSGQWLLASVRAAFATDVRQRAANADLNHGIAASILACLNDYLPSVRSLAQRAYHGKSRIRRPHFQ